MNDMQYLRETIKGLLRTHKEKLGFVEIPEEQVRYITENIIETIEELHNSTNEDEE